MAEPTSQSGRRAHATTVALRRRPWLQPAAALILWIAVGWYARSEVAEAVRINLRSTLQTTMRIESEALHLWMVGVAARIQQMVNSDPIHGAAKAMIAAAAELPVELPSQATLLTAPEAKTMARILEPIVKAQRFTGYVVCGPKGRIVAADRAEMVGRTVVPSELRRLERTVYRGLPTVLPPFRSRILLTDANGRVRADAPTMFVAAPVLGPTNEVLGVVGFRMSPESTVFRILGLGRIGEFGETFAFDRSGLLLGGSRFDETLRDVGLLGEGQSSAMRLSVRDPGVNLEAGERPKLPREQWPLTRAVADAVQGRSGVDVDGYRDYRGAKVVGAWRWLEEHEFGIATEMDIAESHETLRAVDRIFWLLFGLLGLATLTSVWAMRRAAKLEIESRANAIKLRRLGQYTLEEKLGEGAMGVVYRASHAMLSRPTAVKFLNVDRADERSIVRFEREVQLTSRLRHPNTIAIYDYGRTPEGVFYYAMELVEGLGLDELVRDHGTLPQARVIAILRQVCGSLAEAHAAGLIHRDIKPANIMLSNGPGLHDFVTVLDFGLVKSGHDAAEVTAANGIVGTPAYLAPEAVASAEKVDARSDVYAVGALAYCLLTGRPPFVGDNLLNVLHDHLHTRPVPPSERSTAPIDPDLEALVMRCLAKRPEDRPATAAEIELALLAMAIAHPWKAEDADRWWRRHWSRSQAVAIRSASRPIELAATLDAPSEESPSAR